MGKYILILSFAAALAASATVQLCGERLVDLGLAASVDGRPLQCTVIISVLTFLFGTAAWWRKGRALLGFYAFAVAMLFASAMVAVLASCSIAINPVRGMMLIVVAAFSQAALAVVTTTSQAATLTLASVLAKHSEEVDINL